MEGKVDMIKSTISLQDLRRGIYIKAKAEPAWRSWQRKGFGWKKWSNQWRYIRNWDFDDYHVLGPKPSSAKAIPA